MAVLGRIAEFLAKIGNFPSTINEGVLSRGVLYAPGIRRVYVEVAQARFFIEVTKSEIERMAETTGGFGLYHFRLQDSDIYIEKYYDN